MKSDKTIVKKKNTGQKEMTKRKLLRHSKYF